MKIWIRAVCDVCGVARHVMVNNPTCSAVYLKEHDAEIQKFLEDHGTHGLRLVSGDQELDVLFNAGWERDGDGGLLRKKK